MDFARKHFRLTPLLPLLMAGASCVPPARAVQVTVAPAPSMPVVEARQTGTVELPPLETPTLAEATTVPAATPALAFDTSAQAPSDRLRALECLTAAVYHEARSESEDGQRAVAQVVLNRVRHPAFPGSVCGVVFQGSSRRTGCQFSFTCDGSLARRIEPAAWARARTIAAAQLDGAVYAPIGRATHYHTTAIRPYWAPSLARAGIVGAHIFYRWPGAQGTAAAFRQDYAGAEPGRATRAAPSTPRLELARVDRWQNDGVTVRIHRGTTPAVPEATEPTKPAEDFGIRVHRDASPVVS